MVGRAAPNVGRSLETGAILGGLVLVLTGTGLMLSPTVGAVFGGAFVAAQAFAGNALYVAHLAASALLVGFTVWHLLPWRRAFSRKPGASLAMLAVSQALLALVVAQVVTGYVLWMRDYRLVGKAAAVQAHLVATFVVLVPLAIHAWRGWRVARDRRAARARALAAAEAVGRGDAAAAQQAGVTRRAFLRLGAYALAAVAVAYAFGRSTADQIALWRVNFVGKQPAIDKDAYRLRVKGLVERPVELTYDQLRALPQVTRRFTHRCVEGWTYTDAFTGVRLSDVLAAAGGVRSDAKMLVFRSPEISTQDNHLRGQAYTTNFPYDPRVLDEVYVVLRVAGEELPALHGGPVRLMSPVKWGYKACKWLTEIDVSGDASYHGYWETLGYHNVGDWPGPIFR